MSGSTLLKWAIAVIIAVAIWKKGIPFVREQMGSSNGDAPAASDNTCVAEAQAASESWAGVTRFNPPYDVSAWDSFRSNVDDRVSTAERKCSCSLDSCTKARQALGELRSLLNETDSMIRGNSPPPAGLVQRQEAIDEAINAARELVLQGK